MISISVNNSFSKIEGLDQKQFNDLRSLLSYTIADYFSAFPPRPNYLLTKLGEFPTGLLYLVSRYLKANSLNFNLNDLRVAPKANPSAFKATLPHTPYPEQLAAAKAIGANKGQGYVCAPTGVGKSVIAVLIIQELAVPTLVVVPSLELKYQMLDTLTKAFGKSKVSEAYGKGVIQVANIDSLNVKKVIPGIGAIILDEYHHSAAKTYRDLNKYAWKDIYSRVGMSATPYRSQDSERLLLESLISKEVYKIHYRDAVSKGYIVPMEAFYIELPKVPVKGITWQQVYKELVVDYKHRNQIISDLMTSLDDEGKATLVLVKEIKHGENLSEGILPFINGLDPTSKGYLEYFNMDEIKLLIGTTGVLGEGIDTKPCEYVIITGLGKSRNAFMQQVGRSFRKYPGKQSAKIIIFYDPSHKFTRDHFKAQCKILLEEYNVIPQKIG